MSFKTFSLKKFYLRRILRIWPLYYLLIFLGFVILPNIDFFSIPGVTRDIIYEGIKLKLFNYLTFFANLADYVPYISHTWSIATEEQFYLIWPILLLIFKRNRLILMISVVIIYLLITFYLKTDYADFIPFRNKMIKFWYLFKIDSMAIGGIFAIIHINKNRIVRFFTNPFLFYSTIIIVILMWILSVKIPYVHFELYSVLFGIIILNFAVNKKIILSLENKVFNYLGNISYGLYMYHIIAIALAIVISRSIGYISGWFICLLSLFFTIGLAAVSYRYFETFFLKLKTKFSKIISGNLPQG